MKKLSNSAKCLSLLLFCLFVLNLSAFAASTKNDALIKKLPVPNSIAISNTKNLLTSKNLTKDEKAILNIYKTQVKAMKTGNLKLYMTTALPETTIYYSTEKQLAPIMKQYRIKSDIKSLEKIYSTNNVIVLKSSVDTVKISGPAFNNNHIECYDYFIKYKGKWYCAVTAIMSTEYIR